jgi:RNA 2',3'-cyclic 3'-phosphodiesterase
MIRSFLAIEFPENLKATIADYLKDLKQVPSKIKWVSPGQSHLTLKFFGSISEELVEKISQALLKVLIDYPRIQLSLKGIGAFPNLFRPRVIWAGLGGEIEILQDLYLAIEQALAPLGIPKEDRPLHPHLTLGRNKLKEVNEPLYRLMTQWSKGESESFVVKEVTLFRSDLKPTGPVYTQLGVFPLKQKD